MFASKSPFNKKYQRDPDTNIIKGAETFKFGRGKRGILFIHGWTSSPRELIFLADSLKGKYKCSGPRLEGHGTIPSDLERTHWKQHLQQVSDEFSELSLVCEDVTVVGLSYGALLALHLAARRKVSRLVLLAPFLYSKGKLFKVISESELIPHLPDLIHKLNKSPKGPINDRQALKNHIAYPTMPLKPLKSLVECSHEAQKILAKIKVPTLICHGQQDETADFEGSVELLKKLGSDSKTLLAFPKSNHIITLDSEKERLEAEIKLWLNNH